MIWGLGALLAFMLRLGAATFRTSLAFLRRVTRGYLASAWEGAPDGLPAWVAPPPDSGPREIRVEFDVPGHEEHARWRVPPIVDVQATLVEVSAMIVLEQIAATPRDDFDDFIDRHVRLDVEDDRTAVYVGDVVIDERQNGSLTARRTLLAHAVGRVLRQFAAEYDVRVRVKEATPPTRRLPAWKRLGSV
jgi:hypothetical protein